MAPALTRHDDLADADADVVAACAEAHPEPFLDTAVERRSAPAHCCGPAGGARRASDALGGPPLDGGRPARALPDRPGADRGWGSVSNAAWSGRAALRVETAALPARWAAGGVSAGRWAAFHPLLTSDPGPLPEFLDEAAHPDGITA
ncbi:hypothetical protein [Streptomyces sp. NPDC090036]|uniref:hypothetical protein n=1 Tax=Streptomyces sp. NPDC090036 TaxID=3365926 RepID=UPI00381043BC